MSGRNGIGSCLQRSVDQSLSDCIVNFEACCARCLYDKKFTNRIGEHPYFMARRSSFFTTTFKVDLQPRESDPVKVSVAETGENV
jgi:hypothetical protein